MLLWSLVLVASVALAGCGKEAGPTTSPLQSPLTAVSPLETFAPVMTPLPEALLGAGFDPAQAVLTADDMSDQFATTYAITQAYQHEGMRAIQVTYPTAVLEHTSAFVEGFATQIEVYDDFAETVTAYRAIVASQTGEAFEMPTVGDESRAFVTASSAQVVVPSSMPGVDNFSYVVIFRKANALAIITIKLPQQTSAATLERSANTVAGRLIP
jgi:hypothetical protein